MKRRRNGELDLRPEACEHLRAEVYQHLCLTKTIFEIEGDKDRFTMAVFKAIIYAHRLGVAPLGIVRSVADAYEDYLRLLAKTKQ